MLRPANKCGARHLTAYTAIAGFSNLFAFNTHGIRTRRAHANTNPQIYHLASSFVMLCMRTECLTQSRAIETCHTHTDIIIGSRHSLSCQCCVVITHFAGARCYTSFCRMLLLWLSPNACNTIAQQGKQLRRSKSFLLLRSTRRRLAQSERGQGRRFYHCQIQFHCGCKRECRDVARHRNEAHIACDLSHSPPIQSTLGAQRKVKWAL